MKTLNFDAKIFKIIGIVTLFYIGTSTLFGLVSIGQQNPTASVISILINGMFWSFLYTALIGSIFYFFACATVHFFWCMFTHDEKYHWFVRFIASTRNHFLLSQPKWFSEAGIRV